MRPFLLAVLVLPLLLGCPKAEPPAAAVPAPPVALPLAAIRYPAAPLGDVADTWWGTPVPDPYRWLEDPDAPPSRAWIEAENALTRGWIDAVPDRQRIEARLTEIWNFERFSVPSQQGGQIFYTRNDGLQNQSVLLVAPQPPASQAEAAPASARVLLDPNSLSNDGTVALAGWSVSDKGRLLAYATADGGSDWNVWHVRDVATGVDLADTLSWVKFSGASWTLDEAGFYYSRYPTPQSAATGALEEKNENQTLWYHRVGTSQAEDVKVYARPDHPKWGISGDVSEDGQTLIVQLSDGTDPKNRVWLQDLTRPNQPVKPLLDAYDAQYIPIGNAGNIWYFHTDKDAPKGRVIAIDIRKPAAANWREIVPTTQDRIQQVTLVGGRFIVTRMHDAHSSVTTYGLDGKAAGEVALPGIGTASGFGGKSTDEATFYSFSSYTAPPTIYRHDVKTGARTVFQQARLKGAVAGDLATGRAVDPSKFVTEQVFFPSKDGTSIPMFLTHRADAIRDGKTPTLLYGYGGFDISLTPGFSPAVLGWLEMGGTYAVVNLRGGGEYGREWHEAGTKERKQNVFDDFAAAADWLHTNGWTDPAHTAIKGGSNGGLLVGASLTQHPERFGAAIAQVGVLDMLRYDRFTIGAAWASDYGTASDSEAMFRYLYGYSPLHNAKPARYPPTLITTGDHDDRVVPAHSFKFAAAMQAAQQDPHQPVLIRIDTRGGHGAGKPTAMLIEEVADQYAFLIRALGMTLPVDFGG